MNTDLISFMDADDIMHPQRIEALQKEDADLILHGFISDDSYIFETHSKIVFEYDKLKIKDGSVIHPENIQFACAHVTVSSRVLQTIKFEESKESELSADTKFCINAINSGFRCAFIPNVLSKGNPSFTCFFEKGMPVVLNYTDGRTVVINPPPSRIKRSGLSSLISR